MKLNISLLAALAALLSATACGGSEPDVQDTLTVTPSSLTLAATGEDSKTVKVSASTSWTATPDMDWLHITPAEDGKSFSVSADDNVSSDPSAPARTATIKVTAGSMEAKVPVKQNGAYVDPLFSDILRNIKDNTLKDYPVKTADSNTKSFLALLGGDGAFTDIDYKNTGLDWTPRLHVSRLLYMVVSYISPESGYYGSESLFTSISNAVSFWYESDPTSTNWWQNEIGWPQYMGLDLCLMRSGRQQISSAMEKKVAERILKYTRDPAKMTAANTQDLALSWFYASVLLEDGTKLKYSVTQFNSPFAQTTGEGIQHDWSYHAHGAQLYMAGYGNSMLTAFFKMACYVTGTRLDSTGGTAMIREFLRNGYIPLHRANYLLFSAGGRGQVSRKNALNNASFASKLTKMAELDAAYATEYQDAAERISARKGPDYNVQPRHINYWRSDYAIHQRPAYSFDMRTASTRTCRAENGNTENLKGYFLCDGCTQVVVDGGEYYNVFPSWSWTHIPGTTVPDVATIPLAAQWGVAGQSTFTGGVTDEKSGCMTYRYVDNNFGIMSSARKSWFCLDDEILCMGAAVKSTNSAEVHTTVNQCLLSGSITAEDSKGGQTTMGRERRSFSDLRWLHQGKVAYLFPEDQSLTVAGETMKGNWNDINGTIADTPTSTDVFLAYLNHGANPESGKYIYYIVPACGSIAEAKGKHDSGIAVENSDKVQAMYKAKDGTFMAVFFEKGSVTLGAVTVEVDSPCCVMITSALSASPAIYVSDPSHTIGKASLNVTVSGTTKSMTASFPTDTESAGKTVKL